MTKENSGDYKTCERRPANESGFSCILLGEGRYGVEAEVRQHGNRDRTDHRRHGEATNCGERRENWSV